MRITEGVDCIFDHGTPSHDHHSSTANDDAAALNDHYDAAADPGDHNHNHSRPGPGPNHRYTIKLYAIE